MMRLPCVAAGVALAMLASGFAREAEADPVHIDFAIEVRHAFGDLSELFGSAIAIGDVVRGSLTYNPGTPDSAVSPVEGLYRSPGSLSFAAATVLSLPLESIWVFEQSSNPPPHSNDVFAAFAITTGFPGFDALQAELFLGGAGQDGDRLPATAEEMLAAFATGGIRFAAWKTGGNPPFDSGTHELFGTVRLLATEPQPVPEPGTLLLLGAGAATILRRCRPHRSSDGQSRRTMPVC